MRKLQPDASSVKTQEQDTGLGGKYSGLPVSPAEAVVVASYSGHCFQLWIIEKLNKKLKM